MEANKQETTKAILNEMRMGNTGDFPFAYMIGDPDTPEVVDVTTKKAVEPRKINIRRVAVSELADRLENAIKRELGNVAAMREALSDACYAMFDFLKTQIGGYEEMADALDKSKAALASMPRNCDVGSAEEQAQRYGNFCKRHKMELKVGEDGEIGFSACQNCEVDKLLNEQNGQFVDCGITWAQMPYTPENKGERDGRK